MKTIGFIDLFIDEWHANNMPAWFRQLAQNEPDKNKAYELGLAWEEAPRDGRPLAQWCREMSAQLGHTVRAAHSIEEVVAESDAICVLAPSNPEAHERLADLALKSGKPVYIDKPFAPDKVAAERLFALADRHGTPLMSCSALRYSAELIAAKERLSGAPPHFVSTFGGGRDFAEYVIHQLEMIVALMGTGAKRVLHSGNESASHFTIEYADARRATLTLSAPLPFAATLVGPLNGTPGHIVINEMSDFFTRMSAEILAFFQTRRAPIPPAETIEIAALVAACIRARHESGQWVPL